ncbi:LptA/OstA family protein [Dongia mobilis]|uniref:LptA/OstA family protein n=1 Tax=Dongia sp. TaxID=1977262 RepID=UPI0026EA5FEC
MRGLAISVAATAWRRKNWLWASAIVLPLVLAAWPGVAQEATPDAVAVDAGASGGSGMDFGDETQPFELGADQGIEWRSKEKTYTARGNAVAKQGDSSIAADTLVFYTSGDEGSFDRIVATGNVKVTSGSSVGYGEHGEYSATEKLLLLTGGNLKIVSESDTVTARDRIEYWTGRNAITARGNAVVVREDTRINGDVATLYFADDAEGKSKLSQIEADGKVKVINGTQTIYSKHFAFNPDTDIALMTGDVRIIDGGNEYSGQRAEIDNKRKISRILGGGASNRVHTLIKPKSTSNNSSGNTTQ